MTGPIAQTTQTTQLPNGDTPRNNGINRGGRGPRRGARHTARGGSAATNERTTLPPGGSRGRGGRGGRGDGRGRRRPQASGNTRTEIALGRVFAGQLTRPDETDAASLSTLVDTSGDDFVSLRADAPVFVPGAPSITNVGPSRPPVQTKPRQPKPPKSKSTAEDIATRTHEDILNGFYECPICTSELGRRSKVWSCKCCWTVFHLSCIRKWSSNEGSAMERPRGEEQNNMEPRLRQWRCPGCNLPQDVLPSVYNCWCEKEIDPRPLPGLPPHSCGQTCSKSRNGCPHPCNSVCHAGPCAPCQAMGPTQLCFCGRHEATKRCVDTQYDKGWSCLETCGEMLPCLRHTCPRPCHEGLCGECDESVHAKCYCGKIEKKMRCRDTKEEKQSEPGIELEESSKLQTWIGSFSCETQCGRLYDCGIHRCEQSCHPQNRAIPHCPSSPDMIDNCQCGKTLLSNIPNTEVRTTCRDPIPTCEKPCGKTLSCKHTCPKVCHTGSCPPCFLVVDVKCRCGRTISKSLCQQGVDEPPQCMRVCKATMNCGRHICGERCCPGERASIERQAAKRKLKPFSLRPQTAVEDIEAEHICTRVCGRTLKCSKHQCQELCHKGSCKTCPEAIFEEISCSCGRTILYPPLPCGTTAPTCHYNCERQKACGHPQTVHGCHPDTAQCPKCPYLVNKRCLCGRVSSKQPCSQPSGQCAHICTKLLKCGAHECSMFCHRPGECADAKSPCTKNCLKRLKTCGHPCQEPCHAPYPCPESTPCKASVMISCACGRLTEQKKCGATRDKPRTPDEHLQCDDECSRLKRNRDLASALKVDIDPVTTSSSHPDPKDGNTLPYSDETLNLYINLSSSSTLATLQGFEASLHSLATHSAEKSIRFQPCRSNLRAFIHSLAEDWGFRSESFDPEPSRHVLVYKAPGWLSPPVATPDQHKIGIRGFNVTECIKLRDRERLKAKEARIAAEKERREAGLEANKLPSEIRDDEGWSKVAARKKPQWWNGSDAPKDSPDSTVPKYGPSGNGSTGFSSGRFGSLILKSGVGRGKDMASSKKTVKIEDVADDWEEALEKEEKEEKDEEKAEAETKEIPGSLTDIGADE